ncbi:histidine phosphatase family protein [Tumebacillus algifaecis]|nr:histidine phosphatase family protein [Tumebacillus algifaecis]
MNQLVRLTLVRHGETIWNREMRLQGSQDIPLSEIGLAQAEAVAKRLSAEQFHALYSSHLQRAHKTAETIASRSQVPHHVAEDLRERHFGEVEGLTREEILRHYPEFWNGDHTYDVAGVESFVALRDRAHQAIDKIADHHLGEHVVIVSHGGTINAFLNAFLNAISAGLHGSGVNKLGNTSITRVFREADGSWQIIEIGCTAHLDG